MKSIVFDGTFQHRRRETAPVAMRQPTESMVYPRTQSLPDTATATAQAGSPEAASNSLLFGAGMRPISPRLYPPLPAPVSASLRLGPSASAAAEFRRELQHGVAVPRAPRQRTNQRELGWLPASPQAPMAQMTSLLNHASLQAVPQQSANEAWQRWSSSIVSAPASPQGSMQSTPPWFPVHNRVTQLPISPELQPVPSVAGQNDNESVFSTTLSQMLLYFPDPQAPQAPTDASNALAAPAVIHQAPAMGLGLSLSPRTAPRTSPWASAAQSPEPLQGEAAPRQLFDAPLETPPRARAHSQRAEVASNAWSDYTSPDSQESFLQVNRFPPRPRREPRPVNEAVLNASRNLQSVTER